VTAGQKMLGLGAIFLLWIVSANAYLVWAAEGFNAGDTPFRHGSSHFPPQTGSRER
jgi:hypothetical protein